MPKLDIYTASLSFAMGAAIVAAWHQSEFIIGYATGCIATSVIFCAIAYMGRD